jgi:hypothetical protein
VIEEDAFTDTIMGGKLVRFSDYIFLCKREFCFLYERSKGYFGAGGG